MLFLYPKTSKEFLLSQRISENYNEQEVFYKKVVLKKRLLQRCFAVNLVKLLKTPFSKNIRERLFERFPTWANDMISYIGREEDVFSKTKESKKTF